jgi:beta-galactosidase
MHNRLLILFLAFIFVQPVTGRQKQSFNSGWEFVKNADTVFSSTLLQKQGQVSWERVSLPHTANLEPVVKVAQQWQGVCFYRKFFTIPASYKGKHVALQFDAAMQDATVYLNGERVFNHTGGYLPFYIDITGQAKYGAENSIVIRLDNRDNPLIPPGKPLKSLDFNYYSGIYRDAWLIVKNKLHIPDAVAANHTATGGIFVHYENIREGSATLVVQTEVKNDETISQDAGIRSTLKDRAGKTVAGSLSGAETVAAGETKVITQRFEVNDPKLWSPEDPYLYQLAVNLVSNGKTIETHLVKTGIRTIRFDRGACYLNGKKIWLRGTNRHQEYPWIGYAASDNAQYRDAWKIKQAGFNFVRSSHYPQSPAYLDACDELGIMVMDAIPGWQYVGNEQFQRHSFQDSRDMIRRDRNHPSIILWETSLNESGMKKDFMETAHAIVHSELPFDGIYSAGWIDDVYDVFLPARQHGKAPDYWKKYSKSKPLLIAEYGDWEYYAQNAGFNQTDYKDLKPEERTSRQLRGWGEKRLLQQALNYQEAHNDNLYSPVIGDANWLMFDYNRGYAPDIESSGIMDMTRLPKFSFYFYQSQTDPVVTGGTPFNKPMLYIASYWQPGSDTDVKIYSNCSEVELFLNGKSLGRRVPDTDRYSTNLKHAPFTFKTGAFAPGNLLAIGYIGGKKVVTSERKTAGDPAEISLSADISGKELAAGRNDFLFVYASLTDKDGTVNYEASNQVDFSVSGDAEIIGPVSVSAEAGIATVLVKAGAKPGKITVRATSKGLHSGEMKINSK